MAAWRSYQSDPTSDHKADVEAAAETLFKLLSEAPVGATTTAIKAVYELSPGEVLDLTTVSDQDLPVIVARLLLHVDRVRVNWNNSGFKAFVMRHGRLVTGAQL